MEDLKQNIKPENLIFLDHCSPQLAPGKYNIKAGMKLKLPGAEATGMHEDEKTFYVDAPRFTLDPSVIYSTYPPKNFYGELHTTLPHIVFKRRTLPWERT